MSIGCTLLGMELIPCRDGAMECRCDCESTASFERQSGGEGTRVKNIVGTDPRAVGVLFEAAAQMSKQDPVI